MDWREYKCHDNKRNNLQIIGKLEEEKRERVRTVGERNITDNFSDFWKEAPSDLRGPKNIKQNKLKQ